MADVDASCGVIAMAEDQDLNSHTSVHDQVIYLYEDLENEARSEALSPHDSSQSDVLVKKHVTGLAIGFFILIGLFLLATIAAIAIYGHAFKSAPGSTTSHIENLQFDLRV